MHFGLATHKATERTTVLARARLDHPERFGTPSITPKILDLPTDAWINKPATDATAAEPETDQPAA
ncbi:hypothetical protein ACFWAY_24960 [Rhodococcus sp. NPDC059968]|uniref:hypothetical protein n=1 Tax=Rhodococcus sp. NPDC059968 TaxID=3347017 RepID=UPI00366F4D41